MAAIVVAVVAGCGGGGGGGDSGSARGVADADLELGEEVYAQRCSGCHGPGGQGGTGPPLGGGVVVDLYPDAADHRAVVVDGRGQMPAWGEVLTEEEIDAVVRYEREQL